MKEYKKAVEDFDTTIKMNPKYAMAYASRGQVYEEMKQYDKSIEDYKTAARLGDKDTAAYLKSKKISW